MVGVDGSATCGANSMHGRHAYRAQVDNHAGALWNGDSLDCRVTRRLAEDGGHGHHEAEDLEREGDCHVAAGQHLQARHDVTVCVTRRAQQRPHIATNDRNHGTAEACNHTNHDLPLKTSPRATVSPVDLQARHDGTVCNRFLLV